jgi:hypothetical protein
MDVGVSFLFFVLGGDDLPSRATLWSGDVTTDEITETFKFLGNIHSSGIWIQASHKECRIPVCHVFVWLYFLFFCFCFIFPFSIRHTKFLIGQQGFSQELYSASR